MKTLTFAVIVTFYALNANAGSIDCSKTSTKVEKSVCADEWLAKLYGRKDIEEFAEKLQNLKEKD